MLTDARIRRLKGKAKPYKVADRDGLYLLVQSSGARWWRWDYRLAGIRKTLSVGVYPDVGLEAARDRLRDERKRLAAGQDPSAVRKSERLAQEAETHTFAFVAREWLGKRKALLSEKTHDKINWLLDAFLLPAIGDRAIASLEPPDLLAVLQRIELRGRRETAHRAKGVAGQVFRYAVATNRAKRDPTGDLRGALAPVATTHHPAVTDPAGIAELLRAIEGFSGSFTVLQALRLAPLVFVRPGELRQAEWAEIDLDAAVWRIPASKMKMREPHIVPLATQAVTILTELQPLTGRGRYVFPSNRSTQRPMSDNTVNAALRRLGYTRAEMTAHGFRTIASTRLNEMGWRPDLIERQLAHVEKDGVRAAYNRAQYVEERRRMMQAWADTLDSLRAAKPTLVAAS